MSSKRRTGVTGESLRLDADEREEYTRTARGIPFFAVDDSATFDPTKTLSQFSSPSEYLKSVRHEASQLPGVCRAKKKPESQSSKHTNLELFTNKPLPGKEYAPSPQFVERVVQRYEHARALFLNHVSKLKTTNKTSSVRPKLPLSPLPSWNDKQAWRYFCLGNEKKKKSEIQEQRFDDDVIDLVNGQFTFGDTRILNQPVSGEPGCHEQPSQEIQIQSLKKGFPPLMRIVLRFDSPVIEALLRYHTEWIVEYGFSHEQGSWIYALLAAISLPLWPQATAIMRTLSKTCALERATAAEKSDQTLLCSLNVIIAVIGKFFGQTDMLD